MWLSCSCFVIYDHWVCVYWTTSLWNYSVSTFDSMSLKPYVYVFNLFLFCDLGSLNLWMWDYLAMESWHVYLCSLCFRFQTWTRTRITTNSNSSQRPNKCIIRNFKNSKPLESSKHIKRDQIWTKITTPQLNNHAKKKKRRNEKRRQLLKPLPSFSFFRPLLSLFLYLYFLYFCLCKWWWVIKTKEYEKKKKKEGVLEVAFFFLSSFFVCFLIVV